MGQPKLRDDQIGIVVAWLVQPKVLDTSTRGESALRLVFAATVIDQARRKPRAGDADATVRLHQIVGGRRG